MLGFLVNVAGDNLHDKHCIQLLLENISYKNTSYNVLQISWVVKGHQKKLKPRHPLSPETHKAVYEFWLNQENAIVSTDHWSSKDEVCISELEYLQDYAHCINISDTNITEK